MRPLTGSLLCFAHDPERADARREARSLGGQNAHSGGAYAHYDVEAENARMDEIAGALFADLDATTREWLAEQDRLLEPLGARREQEDRELAQIIGERGGTSTPATTATAYTELEDERESEPDDILLDADDLDGVTPQLDDLDMLLGPD